MNVEKDNFSVDMILISDNTVFEEMADITIFSLNIVENSVNILGEVF